MSLRKNIHKPLGEHIFEIKITGDLFFALFIG